MCGRKFLCGVCIFLSAVKKYQRPFTVSHTSLLRKPPLGPVNEAQTRHGRGFSIVYLSAGAPWGIVNQRVYVKTQMGYNCRPPWRGWRCTPTSFCEVRALTACAQLGLPVPKVLSYRIEENVAELVLDEIENSISLDDFMAHSSAVERSDVVASLASILARMHRSGWSHGALGSGHILIQPKNNNRIWLIDFEKARKCLKCGQRDLSRLWRRSSSFTEIEKKTFYAFYTRALR